MKNHEELLNEQELDKSKSNGKSIMDRLEMIVKVIVIFGIVLLNIFSLVLMIITKEVQIIILLSLFCFIGLWTIGYLLPETLEKHRLTNILNKFFAIIFLLYWFGFYFMLFLFQLRKKGNLVLF